ncbi:MAG: hypothetical protein ACRDO2_09355 [Nocardioidaceae bacterium]
MTAYRLTSTASTPLWGKISDLYGRRLIFQAAIVIFVLGSLHAGMAQGIGELIAFRAVGAATLVASVSSLLLFTTWAGPDDRWGSPVALLLKERIEGTPPTPPGETLPETPVATH